MDTIDIMLDELRSYDPALIMGLIAVIATFVLELILSLKGILFSGGKRKLERAISMGHVVTAQLESCYYQDKDTGGGITVQKWIARYQYQVDDIKNTKMVISTSGRPGPKLTLYYDKNPRKAFTKGELENRSTNMLMYIIPFMVGLAVAWLMGYRP